MAEYTPDMRRSVAPPADRPCHTPHAVADLNQSETRNVAIFSADFYFARRYHKQRLRT